MSTPENPLSRLTSYTTKFHLLAFPSYEAASTAQIGLLSDKNAHAVGQIYNAPGACEPGMIMLNDVVDGKYGLHELLWRFDYRSPLYRNTTAAYGTFTIVDRPGGYFLDELKTVSQRFNKSISQMAWSLTTFFIGQTTTGENLVIKSKPLIFSIVDNTYSIGQKKIAPVYKMYFLMAYNSIAQMDTLSSLSQTTITHKESPLSNEIPPALGASGGIMLRSQEDGIKKPARKIRQDKSKPMKNLKDIFMGLEKEFNDQNFEHKRQLQEWLAKVNTNYSYKIKSPKQKKDGGKPLPIDYYFEVDDYAGYLVDNRNLYFEQPEQSQIQPGIRSITLPNNLKTFDAIDHLMKYSKRVGEDAKSGKIYKVNVSVYTTCSTPKYKVMHKIKKINNPFNLQDFKDTGPGEGAINPLEFVLHDSSNPNPDIISVTGFNTTDVDYGVHEEQTNDTDTFVVMGDREQITLERAPERPFFKTAFSGKRFLVSPNNFTLEYGDKSAAIDYQMYTNSIMQNSSITLRIVGNPDLMSDIARNPLKTFRGDPDSPALYKHPEYFPMYVKLSIKIRNNANIGQITPENEPEFFYHTYYYHVSSVVNYVMGGIFTQELVLLRRDGYA
jgi:hypothetical protein